MGDSMDDRLDRVEDRLRQVLELLANATVANTTIPDPNGQGDFEGNNILDSVAHPA